MAFGRAASFSNAAIDLLAKLNAALGHDKAAAEKSAHVALGLIIHLQNH